MFSLVDRELRWSGICTTRQDLPQASPEVPNIGSCGSRFARLVGKFTHRGTKNRKGVRNEWHTCCGHVVSPRRSMSVPLPALGVQKEKAAPCTCVHDTATVTISEACPSRAGRQGIIGTRGSDSKRNPLASSPRPLSAGDHAPHRPLRLH